MGPIMESVLAFFKQDEWEVRQLGDSDSVVQVGFRGDNGEWDCLAVVLEPSSHFLFYSVCPVSCPQDKIRDMMEFLHRANHGLNLGNFEFDVADGEIRFKTSVRMKQTLDHELCQGLIHSNVLVMDEYMPGIKGIIEIDMSPEAAIMIVEHPSVGEA
jgi:hypothetical protein